ncbi:hypothetical protein EYC84_011411 [Monilinia fructicola]|uniref:Uncharacterized protein n=1 Tax=Monilinia fructicola TaxID=38448 RepID=A0A5M9J556_MONFR|nr:hypothetical protein EYC84_011411 [Monilinia fructicola]
MGWDGVEFVLCLYIKVRASSTSRISTDIGHGTNGKLLRDMHASSGMDILSLCRFCGSHLILIFNLI